MAEFQCLVCLGFQASATSSPYDNYLAKRLSSLIFGLGSRSALSVVAAFGSSFSVGFGVSGHAIGRLRRVTALPE